MLLEAVEIGKSFPPSTQALDGVDFQLRAGEVHALVGENGAGKSTLSAILAGIHQPDTGRLALNGAAFAPQHRREGEAAGIRIVLQELNLIDTLSVGESVLFDRLPHRWGWISQGRLRSLATEALSWVGLESLDPSLRVASLSVGHRQLVEIAAGLAAKAAGVPVGAPLSRDDEACSSTNSPLVRRRNGPALVILVGEPASRNWHSLESTQPKIEGRCACRCTSDVKLRLNTSRSSRLCESQLAPPGTGGVPQL